MGKKLKGKLCVYCAKRPSTTDDYIFAREFFLVKDRANLPKAPACKDCNDRKSRLEHYLASVLPFGGRHTQAIENLENSVAKRLAKNRKLHFELLSSSQQAWMREGGGLYKPSGSVSFDGAKLDGLLKYIARGLSWYHWQTYIGPQHHLKVMFLTDTLSVYLQDRVRSWNAAKRVSVDLGAGTVEYEGIQAADPQELAVWGISMYGGVMLSNARSRDGGDAETSCRWWVVTGPPEIAQMLDGLKR